MSSPPLSSSIPSSSFADLFFLHSTPLYPCLLPTFVTHTLYVTVVTDPPTLYTIENLPFYKLDLSSQELVCLLLDTFHFHLQYIRTSPNPEPSLLHINAALFQWILNALHLHGFHFYLKWLNPENVEQIFLSFYESMSSTDQEQYWEIATSSSREGLPEPIPIPPPIDLLSISSPSFLTYSLVSHLSFHPASCIHWNSCPWRQCVSREF